MDLSKLFAKKAPAVPQTPTQVVMEKWSEAAEEIIKQAKADAAGGEDADVLAQEIVQSITAYVLPSLLEQHESLVGAIKSTPKVEVIPSMSKKLNYVSPLGIVNRGFSAVRITGHVEDLIIDGYRTEDIGGVLQTKDPMRSFPQKDKDTGKCVLNSNGNPKMVDRACILWGPHNEGIQKLAHAEINRVWNENKLPAEVRAQADAQFAQAQANRRNRR